MQPIHPVPSAYRHGPRWPRAAMSTSFEPGTTRCRTRVWYPVGTTGCANRATESTPSANFISGVRRTTTASAAKSNRCTSSTVRGTSWLPYDGIHRADRPGVGCERPVQATQRILNTTGATPPTPKHGYRRAQRRTSLRGPCSCPMSVPTHRTSPHPSISSCTIPTT